MEAAAVQLLGCRDLVATRQQEPELASLSMSPLLSTRHLALASSELAGLQLQPVSVINKRIMNG